MDFRLPQPCAHCLIDDGLQTAAMNRKLGYVVARSHAARLPPYLLSETVRINKLRGADGDRVQPVLKPQFR